MTAVTAFSSTYTAANVTAASTAATSASNTLNSDAFLQLLLVELQNQDPLEPMDNSQMMTQFTSLNSLSTLQSISDNIEDLKDSSKLASASNLIGKTVLIGLDDGTTTQGIVSSISQEDGDILVNVGGTDYSMSDILAVAGETA